MEKEIGVWRESEETINLITKPVSSIAELKKVLAATDGNMLAHEKPPFALVFRGQDSSLPLLPKSLKIVGGDIEKTQSTLQAMLAICKTELGGKHTDNEVYFMMRHAGLPSHLLDWSWRWEIALWFAIHDTDGSLKKRESSLWILRPILRDFQGGDTDHGYVKPVFFPADQQTCDGAQKQDGSAYSIRFVKTKNKDGVSPLPMNYDPIYSERLIRVPISLDLDAMKAMEAELREIAVGIDGILTTTSPLSCKTVEKCHKMFQASMG